MNAEIRATSTRDLAAGQSATRFIVARNIWNDTSIQLIAGNEYRLTAAGQWSDWYIPCTADGFASPNMFLRIFEWLRRAPHERWFALIGAIDRNPRTQFLIGAQRTMIAPATGKLTCFANDVGFAYWNNRGSVELTITRLR